MSADYGIILSGVQLPEDEDPLGVCQVAPPSAQSFAVGESAPDEPTWQVRLPADEQAARHILHQTRAQIAHQEANLALIRQELATFSGAEQDSVSFSTPAGHATRFEAQKVALQARLQTYAPQVPGEILPAFGLLDRFKRQATSQKGPQTHEDMRQWLRFVRQVEDMLTHYARIQTSIAEQWRPERLIASTRVGWTGNFRTTWIASASSSRALHCDAVHTALASRQALLHLVAVVIGGASGLAVKATALPPGGQVLLLPATWRFVKDVLAAVQDV